MVNNSVNINRMNNPLSTHIIENKRTWYMYIMSNIRRVQHKAYNTKLGLLYIIAYNS